jgi:type IV secretion system protein VirD4
MAQSIWETNKGIYVGFAAAATEGELPSRKRWFRPRSASPVDLNKPLRYTGDRHICLIGPNRSGKTKRLLIPALHDLTGWSCVVNDIRGDLCAMTQEHRRAAGNHIIKLNPFNVLGMGSDGFNPIAALELTDDFPDDALELAEAVIRVEGKEPHWPQAAQEWVAAIIMYVRLMIPDGSFADVRALLGQNDDGIRSLVLSPGIETENPETGELEDHYFEYKGLKLPGMIEAASRTGWEEIAVKASRFGDITPENREIHSVLSTALTQTRWLDSRRIKADLAKNPFDYSVMKDQPVTVYLIQADGMDIRWPMMSIILGFALFRVAAFAVARRTPDA